MLEYLSFEDLPKSLQDLVEIIGIEAFRELIKFYGGCSLYIPNEKSIIKPIRNRLIKESFKGDNHKELAQVFKISEMQIRNVLNIE